MVAIADIRNQDSLRAWLVEQDSYEFSVTIAARAALRVQPYHWQSLAPARQEVLLTALVYVRTSLISSVAAVGPTDDIKAAARAAARAADAYAAARAADADAAAARAAYAAACAAYADAAAAYAAAAARAADAAARAADAAARAAYADAAAARAYADAAAAYASVRTNCKLLLAGESVWATALWPEGETDASRIWSGIAPEWRAAGAPWDFFADWYQGLADGHEPDWPLLTRIALIPPDQWEGNDAPAKIAKQIGDLLKARSTIDEVIAETPNAEQVVIDAALSKLTTVPVMDLGPAFRAEIVAELETAVRRFHEACDEPGRTNLGGVLRLVSNRHVRYLQQDLSNASLGDRAFYDAIESCHATLVEGFRKECPEGDPDANRFLNALDRFGLTVIASSDAVRDIVHRRTEEMFYRLQAEQQLLLQDWVLGMIEDSAPQFADQMRRDWAMAGDAQAAPEDRRRAQYNIISRVPRGARAIRYSRFEGGYRVVPEKQTEALGPMWWATVLSPLGATLLARAIGM